MGWRALLCDIDGVLRHWDWSAVDELERQLGAPAGALRAAAFAPERLLPAITGEVTDEQWRVGIAGVLAPAGGSTVRAADLVARWSAGAGRIDGEVLELLVEVQRTRPVVLVTNATTRLERDLARLGVAAAIRLVVNSSGVRWSQAMSAPSSDGRLVDIGDTRLNVVERGRGYPLLLLHGGPGLDHHEFADYLDPLAGTPRLLLIDQRAQGRSAPADPATWTLRQMA